MLIIIIIIIIKLKCHAMPCNSIQQPNKHFLLSAICSCGPVAPMALLLLWPIMAILAMVCLGLFVRFCVSYNWSCFQLQLELFIHVVRLDFLANYTNNSGCSQQLLTSYNWSWLQLQLKLVSITTEVGLNYN